MVGEILESIDIAVASHITNVFDLMGNDILFLC